MKLVTCEQQRYLLLCWFNHALISVHPEIAFFAQSLRLACGMRSIFLRGQSFPPKRQDSFLDQTLLNEAYLSMNRH